MREEKLSSFGAQDTDRRGHELSNLGDIEFIWEDPAVDMDSVCRPVIDSSFYPSTFDDFQMGSTAANPLTVDYEEDKDISAPTTTKTPESQRPTEPPKVQRSLLFQTRLEKVADCVYRTLFL